MRQSHRVQNFRQEHVDAEPKVSRHPTLLDRQDTSGRLHTVITENTSQSSRIRRRTSFMELVETHFFSVAHVQYGHARRNVSSSTVPQKQTAKNTLYKYYDYNTRD